MHVTLDHALQARIFKQMEDSFPNEGGGFLLGALDGDNVDIVDITGIQNSFESEEQYHRYAMTPHDWMHLEDIADARGLALVGYYHSHPNAPAIPSEFDRDHALPNFVYIITSVRDGRAVDMRAWRLRQDRSQFDAGVLAIV